MYLIAQNKYKFNMSSNLQRCHLLDIHHLNKAHWLTLFGVSVGKVYCKSSSLVSFDLHRFGRVNRVEITQDEGATEVTINGSKLRFIIEGEVEDHHYLHVSLFCKYRFLRLLWPIIQIVFFLTVLEDSVYYSESSKTHY